MPIFTFEVWDLVSEQHNQQLMNKCSCCIETRTAHCNSESWYFYIPLGFNCLFKFLNLLSCVTNTTVITTCATDLVGNWLPLTYITEILLSQYKTQQNQIKAVNFFLSGAFMLFHLFVYYAQRHYWYVFYLLCPSCRSSDKSILL